MTRSQMDVSGRVAMVTGATRGIGRGVAVALGSAGMRVAVAGRDLSLIDEVVGEISGSGGDAFAVPLDVASVPSIGTAVQSVVDHWGSLDVLVNNAGVGFNHAAVDVTEKDWDVMMDVNLKGAFFVAQACGRSMLAAGWGRIINMSSQAGLVGIEDHAVYSASKGGLNMLTKVLALEWSRHGVTVNAIAPTFIYTPGTAARLDDPDYRAAVEARIPAGRVGTISDVAGAVLFLASDASAMVTGTVIPVDGGWTAQ